MDEQVAPGSQDKIDQRDQNVYGPQTNVVGNVEGPILSGEFMGPVTFTITKQHFTGEYERLRDICIDPQQIFDRVDLDHFAGRKWLLATVDAFLREHNRGYFILEAEAGLGKTTFMAWLVKNRGYIQHFCELTPGTDGVETGLKSLTAQLALACHLDIGDVEGMLPTAAKRPDYFGRVLSLAAQSRRTGEKVVLVIDALDVAGTPQDQNTLALPRNLPKGVFIIVSARPTFYTLEVDTATTPRPPAVRLSAGQTENKSDMERFLKAATKWPGIKRALRVGQFNAGWFIKTLLEKCGGVWIYLRFVVYEIEHGERAVVQLDSLPNGIIQYYAAYWNRQRNENTKAWNEVYLPMLATLASVRKALSLEKLLDWSGVSATEAEDLRIRLSAKWRPFLSVTRQGSRTYYQFYHATLGDFFAGHVDWNRLTTAEEEFVKGLRLATIRSLRRMIQTADPQEQFYSALRLVRWHGLDEIETFSADELLGILDLVGGFVFGEAERCYLIDRITELLASPPSSLPKRQRAQLLVHRAGLLGNLGKVPAAASSYSDAQDLADQLVQSGDSRPEDHKFRARILLGRGINKRREAERLRDSCDQASRKAMLEEARELLAGATIAAMTYAEDPLLSANTYKELCWAYVLLQDWRGAEQAYKTAEKVLEQAGDTEACDSRWARVLETAGEMYLEKGKALEGNVSEALQAYQEACRAVKREIEMLEGSGPSECLAIAHFNAGQYRLAAHQLSNDLSPVHLAEVCACWREARDMAHLLGVEDVEQAARENLELHCSMPAAGALSVSHAQQV